MAGSVTFILKDPKSKNTETPIYLVFWYDKIRIKVSTGEKIKPKYWNSDDHRPRIVKEFQQAENLKTSLDTKEIKVMNTARDHIAKFGTVKPETLRGEIVNVLRPKPVDEPETMTFFKSIEQYIKTVNRSPRTKLSYGTTQNTLTKYSGTLKKELDFDDINMDFYEAFQKYCYNIENYSLNTFGDHIKKVKVFMNYANDKGYTTNQGHKHRKFQTVEETAESIYLTDSEITTLYEHDFTKNKKYDRVRDLFIIGCYTGLRFSDLSQLTPDNFIKGGTQLRIKTVKTGEMVVIPLHWTIKEILQKYEGRTPRPISNQKMNDYIKEVCEQAELNEKINMTKTSGRLSFDHTPEKWELVTVHTARRSFCTNMFLAGVPTLSIMKISAHRTERAFMKYIKVTQEQNAELLSKHPYFTKSPLKVVNQ